MNFFFETGKVVTRQKNWYFFLVVTSILLVLIALGPGLFKNGLIYGRSWQHLAFDFLCHQNPDRSFLLNGELMAVCSRCLGIYGTFMIGVLLMPLIPHFLAVINAQYLKLIVITIVINFLDVLGNSIGIWTNTLLSRFLLGSLFGLFLALYLSDEFFKRTNKPKESYGK